MAEMWELSKHLQQGEKIVFECSPEWMGYFWFFVFALLMIWTYVVPFIIIGLIILTKKSTKYAITNKRVLGRSGIIAEDFKSSTFNHITSLNTKQSVVGKIFDFGHIIIDTSGSGKAIEFEWKYVKNPVEVKNKIEKYIH